jgi:hypothetical protein
VLEILTGAGLLEFIEIFVVGALLISFILTRGRSHQVSVLRRENHRLRNILADLMLDNASLKDVK